MTTQNLLTLHGLLDACQSLAPEYGGGMSLHLPMALQALHALGAPPSRLQALFDLHAPRLPRRPTAAGPAAARAPWAHRLGQIEDFEALQAGFMAAVQAEGIAATVRSALPRLLPGVAAAAFHGLIRTAHAVAAGHAGEVAMGLAYWAARYAPLAAPRDAEAATAQPRLPLAQWLAALQAWPAAGGVRAPLIIARMRQCSETPGFAELAGALQIQGDAGQTLDRLARAAAAAYAESASFTLLHAVTASHALRALLPLIDDPDAALRAFARAAAAAVAAAATEPPRPGLSRLNPAPPDWAALVQSAWFTGDEHLIKLVHAAWALHAAAGGEEFIAAAQRAVSLHAPAPLQGVAP